MQIILYTHAHTPEAVVCVLLDVGYCRCWMSAHSFAWLRSLCWFTLWAFTPERHTNTSAKSSAEDVFSLQSSVYKVTSSLAWRIIRTLTSLQIIHIQPSRAFWHPCSGLFVNLQRTEDASFVWPLVSALIISEALFSLPVTLELLFPSLTLFRLKGGILVHAARKEWHWTLWTVNELLLLDRP